MPRLDRRRALMNLGGNVLKFLFASATVHDVHKLHEVFDKFDSRNSDSAHSLTDQLTYIKKNFIQLQQRILTKFRIFLILLKT